MRESCKIVVEVLEVLKLAVKPGVTTKALNQLAENTALKYRAKPAFKGYCGYPASLCCSINEEVVHGIPTDRRLLEGDIVSLDFGVILNSFYGDAAITLPVGLVSQDKLNLMSITEQSLVKAITAAQVGKNLSDISHAVQDYAEGHGFSVVRDFVGHGIGRNLHESPQVPNYGLPGKGPKLKVGMVLAIEPMINAGSHAVNILDDGWTAVTADGSCSAHFEHTVAITENGPLILTQR